MFTRDLRFDLASHSADAIQRAAYRLGDRLSIELTSDDSAFLVQAHLTTDDPDVAEAVLAGFRNEVVDQVLRERIREETGPARNLILSLAFSETGLVVDP